MRLAVVGLLSVFLASPGHAGDADRGLAFARTTCGGCHAVTGAGPSRDRRAPPFTEIARRYDPTTLEEALGEGIMVGHSGVMPEFQLEPRQIDDLVAHLQRLRRG